MTEPHPHIEYDDEQPNDEPGDEASEQPAEFSKPLLLGPYRWSHRSTPNLDDAMAAAQGEIENALENRRNDFLNSSYADNNAVLAAIRGPCSKFKIARYQTPWTDSNRRLILTTRLAHKGEWVEADFLITIENIKGLKQLQMLGVGMTYARRYTLAAMLGVAVGEDNDGNGGGGEETGPARDEQRDDRGNGGAPNGNAQWKAVVKGWAKLEVTEAQLLTHLTRRPGEVTREDIDHLRELYRKIEKKETTVEEAFPPAKAPARGGGKTARTE